MAGLLQQNAMFRHDALAEDNNTAGQHGEYMEHLRAQGREAEFDKKRLGERVPVHDNPRFYNRTADWTDGDIAAMQSVWQTLPADHSRDIAAVNRDVQSQREPLSDNPSEGGESQTLIGAMHIFDKGAGGDFGAAFSENPDRITGDVTNSLRYVTAHETGHFAGKLDATGHAPADERDRLENRFKALTGAQSGIQDRDLDGHLDRLRLSDEQKLAVYSGLEARNHAVVAGRHFHYSGGRTAISGHLPAGDEYGYSGSKSEEHFAELYAQMAQAPEKAHRDYVSGPEAQARAAEDALAARLRTSGFSRFGSFLSSGATSESELRTAALRARARADNLAAQHAFMRRETFGLSDAAVQAADL
ncbi:MAG: hypothetical protein AAFY88_29045, partial [Acidobacteriota bacterium]